LKIIKFGNLACVIEASTSVGQRHKEKWEAKQVASQVAKKHPQTSVSAAKKTGTHSHACLSKKG